MDMKINGVNPSKVVSFYSQNKKSVNKKEQVSKKDSIEISSVGKNLSTYSLDENFANSSEKIEKLKNQVESGTYNIDSKSVAKKILQNTNK
jgi:negative regulator of flagellin synthesis FlgM